MPATRMRAEERPSWAAPSPRRECNVVILDGWKEIIAHMECVSGVERSRFVLWRYSLRRIDPLPIWKALNGRPRAEPEQLAEWWFRHRFTY